MFSHILNVLGENFKNYKYENYKKKFKKLFEEIKKYICIDF